MKFVLDDYSFNFDLNKEQNITKFLKDAKSVGKKHKIEFSSDYDINYSFDENMNSIDDAFTDKLNDLEAMFKPLYEEFDGDVEKTKAEIEEKYQLDEAGIQAEVTDFLNNLKKDFMGKKSKYQNAYEMSKKELETSFASSKQTITQQIETLRNLNEQKLRKQIGEFEKQLKTLEQQYALDVDNLRLQHMREVNTLEDSYKTFSMKVMSVFGVKRLSRDKEALEAKFESLRSETERKSQEAMEQIKACIVNANTQLADNTTNSHRSLESRIGALESSYKANMASLEKKHADELRELYAYVNTEKKRYANVIDAQKANLNMKKERELESVTSIVAAQKEQIEEQYNLQKEEIEEFFANQKEMESENEGEVTGTIYGTIEYEFTKKGSKVSGKYTEELIDSFIEGMEELGYDISWEDGTLVDEEYVEEQSEDIKWDAQIREG